MTELLETDSGARDGGDAPHHSVVIVGAGFAGMCMAIKLLEAGERDFVVLERATEIGGTWRDNSYPGCRCDVPSHMYSFSFAPNPDWSNTYASQPEIFAYQRRVADDFGLERFVRRGSEVLSAEWDEAHARWVLETASGRVTADVVVAGVGPLSEPSIPAIPGIEDFEGTVFHSATWNHDHDLSGRRVAVVGTGASAIQFVPRIAPQVAHLTLVQRTPPWVLPHPGRHTTRFERLLYRRVPALQRLVRAAIYARNESYVIGFTKIPALMRGAEWLAKRHMERQVPDPALRRVLTPDYRIGCKRILMSNDYYKSLVRSNVGVATGGVTAIGPRSVTAGDGSVHEVDTIIFGTGFHVTDLPFADRVRGRDGRTLGEIADGSPQAYLGTTAPNFPNAFLLVGPNTGLGHNSIIYMIEAQVAYVLDALRTMRAQGIRTLEVRADVTDRYNDEIQRDLAHTVWNTGGCASWYLDAKGRNTTLWPTFTFTFKRRLARFDPADYLVTTGVPDAAPVG